MIIILSYFLYFNFLMFFILINLLISSLNKILNYWIHLKFSPSLIQIFLCYWYCHNILPSKFIYYILGSKENWSHSKIIFKSWISPRRDKLINNFLILNYPIANKHSLMQCSISIFTFDIWICINPKELNHHFQMQILHSIKQRCIFKTILAI